MYFFQHVVDNCFAEAGVEMFIEVVSLKFWSGWVTVAGHLILMVINKKAGK